MSGLVFPEPSFFSRLAAFVESAATTRAQQRNFVDDQERQDIQVDSFLQEAMTCPICYRVFDEPKQLSCGHSLCATCIANLRNQNEGDVYACPMCRSRCTDTPTVNYSLKSLISRIKEMESMVSCCFDCAKATKEQELFSCDDCDHRAGKLLARCVLCAMNKHAKLGHNISKYGDTDKCRGRAVSEVQSMANQAKQHLEACRNIGSNRYSVIEGFIKLMDEQHIRFRAMEDVFKSHDYISKKDIDARLTYARRLRDIYMRSTTQYVHLINGIASEITALVERTKMDMDRAEMGEELMGRSDASTSTNGTTEQSNYPQWFEYQRSGRMSVFQSVIARRNAALSRRQPTLPTCDSEVERISNGVNSSFRSIPLHPLFNLLDTQLVPRN